MGASAARYRDTFGGIAFARDLLAKSLGGWRPAYGPLVAEALLRAVKAERALIQVAAAVAGADVRTPEVAHA